MSAASGVVDVMSNSRSATVRSFSQAMLQTLKTDEASGFVGNLVKTVDELLPPSSRTDDKAQNSRALKEVLEAFGKEPLLKRDVEVVAQYYKVQLGK